MSRVNFGIPMVDSLLPECFPRDSFVLLFGEGGTGKSVTLIQASGNKFLAGEPCIFVTFDDSPYSIIENFKRLGFDCQLAMETGLLRIIDCFSFRVRMPPKPNDAIKVVQNPMDHHELTGIILSMAEALEGRGSVFIDSLTEFFTLSEPTSTLETIKNWRAELCKTMGITVYASYHVGVKSIDEFAGMLDYLVDGMIDFRFDPLLAQQGLLARQLRIRKMKGASHDTVWHYFAIEKTGLVLLKSHGAESLAEPSQR
jgi:KaiC/GvpD/RAD55 family RecA-like ATPase